MQVEILTPRKIEFKDEAESLVLPTQAGEITVLPGHAALVSVLKEGMIKIKTKTEEVVVQIEGGALEVKENRVTILLKKFHAHYIKE